MFAPADPLCHYPVDGLPVLYQNRDIEQMFWLHGQRVPFPELVSVFHSRIVRVTGGSLDSEIAANMPTGLAAELVVKWLPVRVDESAALQTKGVEPDSGSRTITVAALTLRRTEADLRWLMLLLGVEIVALISTVIATIAGGG